MWQGSVVSLHIAPQASAKMTVVPQVRAVPSRGLEGDRYYLGTGHYSPRPSPGGREVTLIEMETVEALYDHLISAGGETYGIKISPAETRRNIATRDVSLNHLVGREFWVGAVRMRGTRLCEPCKYLEDLTQPRVMAALLHRGGLRAQILNEEIIRVGDVIRPA